MRYNPNHDEHGRFTFGDGHASGGYVHYVPKGQKGNGQMMFVGAGDTMAQNDALWNSLYGEKSQNSLTNSANSGKIEETVDENQLSLDSITAKKSVSEYKSVTECEDFDQLKQYMKDKYNVEVDDGIKNLHFESVRDMLDGVEYTAKDFPDIMNNLEVVDAKEFEGTASTSGQKLHLNPAVFGSKESVENTYKNKTYSASQSPKETGIHESGHMANYAVIKRGYAKSGYSGSDLDALVIYDWENHRTAQAIVEASYRQATGKDSLRGIKKAREKISEYALESYSETQGDSFVRASRAGNTNVFAATTRAFTKALYDSFE